MNTGLPDERRRERSDALPERPDCTGPVAIPDRAARSTRSAAPPSSRSSLPSPWGPGW